MIRKKHKTKKFQIFTSRRIKKLMIFFLVLTGFLVPYVGFFLYAMEEYNQTAYNLQPPDRDKFLKVNTSRLYAMAMWYEENIRKYHMPHNMIVNTQFNSSINPYKNENYTRITGYSVSYDSAEWTGHYLMGEAYRWGVHKKEGNIANMTDAKNNIMYTLEGIDKIIHVSGNGGMARYAWPIDEYPWDPDNIEDDNHYRVEWEGEEYILEDDTSRDMHNGVIMGLGCVHKIVKDDEVREKVKGLVEDLLDYFLDNGWLYHKPTDDPNGTDLNSGFWLFGTSGIWTLAYLKVGVEVNPDKYGPIYEEYAIERDYLRRSAFPWMSRTNVVQAYYGLLLDWEVLYVLCLLEDNEDYREIYMDYIGQIHDYTKYDRTAQFNAMWLILNDVNRKNANDDEEFIIEDVEDCLMRYYEAIQRFPGRSCDLDDPRKQDPIATKWWNFFEKGWGKILYPFYRSIYQFAERKAEIPGTPDQRPQTDYLWSRSPYDYVAEGDGTAEGPGTDYVAVYWPCRYYNIIGEPEDYNVKVYPEYPGD